MSTRKVGKPLVALVLVLVLALVLLLYVAFVDTFQSYSGFLLDRAHSSAELIEHSIESLLQGGLTLSQLVGFDISAGAIISSDDVIYDITIIDKENEMLFQNSKAGYEVAGLGEYEQSRPFGESDYTVYRSEDAFQLRLPLDGRFDQPGTLLVTVPFFVVSQSLSRQAIGVGLFAVLVVVIYVIVLLVLLKKHRIATLGVNIAYNISVVAVAVFLIVVLFQVYSDGAQQKAQALSNSLSARFRAVFDVGIGIEDIDGIDEVFTDYKRLNPDIAFVSLTKNDIIVAHTDPERVSETYTATPGNIEYRESVNVGSGVAISVAIPRQVAFNRLFRSMKNLGVLFFASAFLSWLMLRILLSVYPNINSNMTSSVLSKNAKQSRALLDLIFPVFFLANFIEGLHYSYLPQFMSQLAVDAGLSGGRVGGIYALYWAMYAIVLIPAGKMARTLDGIRRLLIGGFLLIGSSMALVVFLQDFSWMYLIRAIAGLGQGMVFIAVQSYILQRSGEEQRTEGVSIIVYGYNGGVISGTVIGALLVSSLGVSRLLLISAVIASLMVWYAMTVFGKSKRPTEIENANRLHAPSLRLQMRQSIYVHGEGGGLSLRDGFWRRIKALLTDIEFTKTILLIGMITKAVLTGVTFLALPHFLTRLNYRQEDIGQILMFYAAGVLLVSRLVARYTDRIGNTRRVLFVGAISSAVGLAIIASAQVMLTESSSLLVQTTILICGILVLGLAHGFIHAPILTHITRAPVNDVLGRTIVASVYRFMERIGHVLGPLVFGFFLLKDGAEISSIYYIAIIVGVFGFLFYFLPTHQKS